jgi:hypothetical protein
MASERQTYNHELPGMSRMKSRAATASDFTRLQCYIHIYLGEITRGESSDTQVMVKAYSLAALSKSRRRVDSEITSSHSAIE